MAAYSIPILGGYSAPYQDIEAYTDFRDLYLKQLLAPFITGKLPYAHLGIAYNYPPLWLYLLAPFSLHGLPAWAPALPLVFFDVMTAVPIFLLSQLFLGRRASIGVTMVWILSPVDLLYQDVLWLNPSPSVFFLLLSLLFFVKSKFPLSSLTLAISVGFKQINVVVLPVLFLLLYATKRRSAAVSFLISTSLVSTLLSLPYIVLFPNLYLWSLSVPLVPTPPGWSPALAHWTSDLSEPVRITTFLGYLGMADASFQSYSYLTEAVGVAYVAFLGVVLFLTKRKDSFSNRDLLAYSLYALLIFDALFSRGIYKYYYLPALAILPVLLFKRRHVVFFVALNIAILLLPRYLDPWFAVLLISFLPSLHAASVSKDLRRPVATTPESGSNDKVMLGETETNLASKRDAMFIQFGL